MAKVIGGAAAGLGYLVRFWLWLFPILVLGAGFALIFTALRGYDERLATTFAGVLFVAAGLKMSGGKR